MSALAELMKATNRFFVTKSPADYRAVYDATETLTKEEENEVGGGVWLVNE